jgi:hypothetical protein
MTAGTMLLIFIALVLIVLITFGARREQAEAKARSGLIKIFVCSPFRGADMDRNVEFAEGVCRSIAMTGAVVFAPHLFFTRFLNDDVEAERDAGIKGGLEIMKDCDEVWFIVPSWRAGVMSTGMSHELSAALDYMKPTIFATTPEVLQRQLARLCERVSEAKSRVTS